MALDKDDEALNRWKASLLEGVDQSVDPNDSRRVIIEDFAIVVEGRDDMVRGTVCIADWPCWNSRMFLMALPVAAHLAVMQPLTLSIYVCLFSVLSLSLPFSRGGETGL